MDAFTNAEVDEIEEYLTTHDADNEDPESPPDSGSEIPQRPALHPPHGNAYDPEAWHFDIHGNLIAAPQVAYDTMEVNQLPVPPMHPVGLPFYPPAPPPHMMYRPGMPPMPMNRGMMPMMMYPRQPPPPPDLADMFHAQMNLGRPAHHPMKKSFSHGRSSPPLCHFYAQGRCRNGSNCQFTHEFSSNHGNQSNKSPTGSVDGGNSRICRYYAQGKCRNATNCRFLHEAQPASNRSNSSAASP